MKRKITILILTDEKWDFDHRFRNCGEDVFRALQSTCSVSIHEIDASTDRFMIREIPEERVPEVADLIRDIAKRHFFEERLQVKMEDAEPASEFSVRLRRR